MSNQVTTRKPNGTWAKGYSGNTDGAGGRARRELNANTIREMHRAFREHGREAIDKVIRTQPAAFLKLLVLLIPREFQIECSSAVKSMTDEQLEAGIEALQRYLDAKAAALDSGGLRNRSRHCRRLTLSRTAQTRLWMRPTL